MEIKGELKLWKKCRKGKKKMKRLVVVLILCLSFMSFVICALAEETMHATMIEVAEASGDVSLMAEGCKHEDYQLLGSYENAETIATKIDSQYHRVSKVVDAVCMNAKCLKRIKVHFEIRVEQHTMIDNGYTHESGTMVHKVHQICSAYGCNHSATYSIICDEEHGSN